MPNNVNISIDDVSPHPRSSIRVVDRCFEILDKGYYQKAFDCFSDDSVFVFFGENDSDFEFCKKELHFFTLST